MSVQKERENSERIFYLKRIFSEEPLKKPERELAIEN